MIVADARQNDDFSLDDLIEEFEEARAAGEVDPASFLPPSDHPRYADILVELIRVDLELARRSTNAPHLESYRNRFRHVLADPARFAPIAFEEFRLRRVAGEACTREEYRDQYNIPTDDWPELPIGLVASESDAPASWLRDLSQVDPTSASRIAGATRELPKVGDRFLDFELVGELGRGAFGRAYLARQGDLANRFVALKVTAQITDEPQRLAQLQHTNIVPIYSLHRRGSLQAVCMPFLGPNTLADVLQTFQANRSVPLSGHALVSTMAARQASTVVREANVTVSDLSLDQAESQVAASESLRRLGKMSYLDAAAWIVARLASGLSHAHEHGIVHRDLKPANVLLTDDGEPLILDFNLSSQSSAVGSSAALVGGTLPYMAPEHIVALQRGSEVGTTADIYSLGVILFEMLTGGLPYAVHRGTFEQVAIRMLDDRKQPAISARDRNGSVSRDLATIVGKCLELSPQDRYQTASDLRLDLQRHLDNLPLSHAPNRSIAERSAKWCRRHPRLMSTASVATLASLLVVTLLVAWIARGRVIASNQAWQQAAQFYESVGTARSVFNVPGVDDETLRQAVSSAENAADIYHLRDERHLEEISEFRLLSLDQQQQLRAAGTELLYLLGCGQALLGVRSESESDRTELYNRALQANELACSLLTSKEPPRALLLQRARLLEATGNRAEASQLRTRADSVVAQLDLDRYLLATELNQCHNYSSAIELLQESLRDNPQDYTAWMGLGSAYYATAQFAKAEGCFTTCLVLRPQLDLAHFMRGVSRLKQQLPREAKEDFDAVLRIHPQYQAALVNRALASMALEDRNSAIADLTAAIDANIAETRVYFIRSSLKEQIGDSEGAASDRAEGLRRTPRDEASWIARGFAKLKSEPESALSDFQQALQLNPQSPVALLNTAHVLSDQLHRNDEALVVMNQLVEASPDDPLARVNRGVLLARLARREEAVDDAEAAVQGEPPLAVTYRAACIYALLVDKQNERFKRLAVTWLRAALRAQPTLVETALRDSDLSTLREDPAYRQVIAAAYSLTQDPSRDE